MSNQQHIIKKHILEFHLQSRQQASLFQKTISRIYHRRVIPIIEAVCSELSVPGEIHRIEKLEIEIECSDLDNFEEEFTKNLETQVRQALSEKLCFQKGSPPAVSRQELFSHFMQTGTLPWWIDTASFGGIYAERSRSIQGSGEKSNKFLLETTLDYLINTSPEVLKSFIRNTIHHDRYLKRLVYQLSDDMLVKITHVLSPAIARFIASYTSDIQAVYEHIEMFRNFSQDEIRVRHWRGIFCYLVLQEKIRPENLRFPEDLLLQTAAIYRIDYASLIKRMVQAAEQLQHTGFRFKSDLPEHLAQIYSASSGKQPGLIESPQRSANFSLPEEPEDAVNKGSTSHSSTAIPENTEKLLNTYLKLLKILKKLRQSPSPSKELLQQAESGLRLLTEQHIPAHLKNRAETLLQTLLFSDSYKLDQAQLMKVLNQILQELEAPPKKAQQPQIIVQLLQIVHVLEQFPALSAKKLQRVTFELQTLFEQPILSGIRPEIKRLLQIVSSLNQGFSPGETENKPDRIIAVSDDTIKALEQEIHKFEAARETQTISEVRLLQDAVKFAENTFSESEEIYVYNAGLVVLWPYLPPYFEMIGLVRDKEFIYEDAAKRAVLLLQYLTDGSTETPEYLLPLNKILCGIDLAEPVPKTFEITEQEQIESEALLSEVIQNWAALKSVSGDGFRSAFLQREGILKARDTNWLLRIERKTLDILVDKIPWSIRVVKLPWMDRILYVEW